jgi:hypothetical protein
MGFEVVACGNPPGGAGAHFNFRSDAKGGCKRYVQENFEGTKKGKGQKRKRGRGVAPASERSWLRGEDLNL